MKRTNHRKHIVVGDRNIEAELNLSILSYIYCSRKLFFPEFKLLYVP